MEIYQFYQIEMKTEDKGWFPCSLPNSDKRRCEECADFFRKRDQSKGYQFRIIELSVDLSNADRRVVE